MSTPLLAAKLYITAPRADIVMRQRLTDRLNEGLAKGGKLTLISAPAGFGKTTLVSEWIAQCERPVAWLSLDERDSDLTRFLSFLIAALQTIKAGIGESLPVWSRHVGNPILASNLTRRVDNALFMVEALKNDTLNHEAPAIVGCHAPSALAHAILH